MGRDQRARYAELAMLALVYLLVLGLALAVARSLPNLFDTPLPEWRWR